MTKSQILEANCFATDVTEQLYNFLQANLLLTNSKLHKLLVIKKTHIYSNGYMNFVQIGHQWLVEASEDDLETLYKSWKSHTLHTEQGGLYKIFQNCYAKILQEFRESLLLSVDENSEI